MHFIYLVTNLINNKVYVGKTKRTVSRRWAEHVQFSRTSTSKCLLYRAIRKYGRNCFDVQILATTETSEQASNLEQIWITLLQATNGNYGYNLTLGGESGPKTEITRQHMSEARKGMKLSPTHSANIAKAVAGEGNPFYGKKHSEDSKKKISAAHAWDKHRDYRHDVSNEEIQSLYESGLSLRKVGKLVGLTSRSIANRMEKLNIPRRDRKEAVELSRGKN